MDIVERLKSTYNMNESCELAIIEIVKLRAEIEALRLQLAENNEMLSLKVLAEIREIMGVGHKPMLSELADILVAQMNDLKEGRQGDFDEVKKDK